MPLILIVEDNGESRYMLEVLLRGNGYEVVSAENGKEALEIALATPPALIVSDIFMPVMDGFTLCKEWKKDTTLRLIPFVFYTATYTDPKDIDLGLSLGAARFLIKPLEPDLLLKTINDVLAENATGIPDDTVRPSEDEMQILKQYNEALFRKLDKKMCELTTSNRTLQREIEKRQLTETMLLQEKEKINRTLDLLRESEERYKKMVRAVTTFTYRVHVHKGRSSATEHSLGCMPITGYSPEEYASNPSLWFSMIYPDDRMAVEKALQDALAGQDVPPIEHRIIRKDSTVVWVRNTIVPHRDATGKVISYDGLIENITDRKLAEMERARLATAIEQADELIIITDKDGSIQYVNPSFERITGYAKAEVIGHTPRILKSGMQEPAFYATLWETITRGDIWRGHFINKKKDGALYNEEATITPIKTPGGDIINYVGVKRDVTREMELERQVRQTQKMEAIGTLAGGIAHDFNNILSAIVGYTELALDNVAKKSSMSDYLTQVLKSAERATDLVRQILTFSRQTEKEKKPVRMSILVKEACKFLKASLPSTIELRQTIQAPDALVMGDPTQIHQIIMNLCTNAHYAMKDTGGVLEINLDTVHITNEEFLRRYELKRGVYVRMTVRDTGGGIAKEHIDKIFDPYFTTKSVGEGTGLGLAVVHGIVKDYSGAIVVESEPGQGAHFNIYLPLVEHPRQIVNEAADELTPGGNETILFIDDEAALIEAAHIMLQQLGYRVFIETRPEEALRIFKNDSRGFDLIITDKTMPYMTGFDIAREVRCLRQDIPIILCTGNITMEDKKKIEIAPITEVVMKPINRQALAGIIRKVLQKKQ